MRATVRTFTKLRLALRRTAQGAPHRCICFAAGQCRHDYYNKKSRRVNGNDVKLQNCSRLERRTSAYFRAGQARISTLARRNPSALLPDRETTSPPPDKPIRRATAGKHVCRRNPGATLPHGKALHCRRAICPQTHAEKASDRENPRAPPRSFTVRAAQLSTRSGKRTPSNRIPCAPCCAKEGSQRRRAIRSANLRATPPCRFCASRSARAYLAEPGF